MGNAGMFEAGFRVGAKIKMVLFKGFSQYMGCIPDFV